jgi:hypothetical protein
MMTPKFTLAEVDAAVWRPNCGPTALAAICGLTLDEARSHMLGFEAKGYTNPTMMMQALRMLCAARRIIGVSTLRPGATGAPLPWPRWGLCRIQWEGPWTKPGVPMRARYRYTHWIGAAREPRGDELGVWDVNALENGTGWCSRERWAAVLVPYLTAEIKRATGGWHVTHAIEVQR